MFLCIFIFVQPTLTWAETGTRTALSYLTNMVEAHKKSSYELLYILQQNGRVESFRLRHTFMENKAYSQLLNLDHSREEIILNDNTVSYLGLNFRPFSLNSSHILDNLPNVLYTDYSTLTGYVFLDSGKDRISDRNARVIRLVPNDKFRYAYTLWIDDKTNLLLKSQLVDKQNVVLEEFRVLHLYQSSELEMIASTINSLILPPITAVEKENIKSSYKWDVNWLPLGFHLIEDQTMSGKQYALENENIDSRLYSDGLSTFNIYMMPSQGITFNEYAWQQGKLTILNQTINDKDIVVIGEIPLESAQRILRNIQFLEEPAQ
ncbi:MucB/RseB C-terminal domain-containing protein [Mannheimia sp. AT1]|uniref:MucB/RseB C-terminal domain-containing protein n=1 Tax=Mannheimia cairinae TaxID=3025936 RepID=A0ABT5MRU5_9PAST|nr:MucB/RseB C-terminal domain-containing protein [Mannheimia cairinae]MDD0823597.1 MucB/RseB C-terminal domain-containing protein [Mannheimia cairinae]MDD0825471.1 MucB/RseB C-terminal domain-containing protein [Mannheimia cairinae]